MKTKLKRVSRSTLAVILAIMMVFSTMLVGTISVSAASYFTAGSTIYLDYSSCSWWVSNTTDALDAHFLNSSDSSVSASVEMSSVSGADKIYSCTVPSSGSYDQIKFTRNSSHVSSPDSGVWNSATTSVYDGSSNMWKFTNDSNQPSGQWSTYDTSQDYYIRGEGDGVLDWDSAKAQVMTKSDDGTYYYYEVKKTNSIVKFKIAKTTSGWDYDYSNTSVRGSTITINKADGDSTNFVIDSQSNSGIDKYYIIFYPDPEGGNNIKVQASTSLPGSTDPSETTAPPTTEPTTVAPTTAPAPTQSYFYSYYDGSTNKYESMTYDPAKGLYYIYVHSGIVRIEDGYYKIKITNNQNTNPQSASNSNECANYPIYDETTGKSVDLRNSSYLILGSSIHNLAVSFDGEEFRNLQFPTLETSASSGYTIGAQSSDNQLVITYKPGDDNALLGTIGLWTTTDYDPQTPSGLTTPKLKGDTSVIPNSDVTVSIDNQKAYYADPDAKTALEGLSFTFEVKNSSNQAVTLKSQTSSGKFKKADGTTNSDIIDKITFTAGEEGETYTVKATVNATGKTPVSSEVLTITVTYNAIKSSNRIYAYALPLADGAKPTANNAWTAAENADASQMSIYKDSSSATTYPSLGSTSATNLRIFLPSTASDSQVTLFNSFSSNITVNGETIPANNYATIKYTPGRSMTVTGATPTSLTIYTSDAQSAVYLNNTGATYSGYTTDGVPNMLKQIYDNKETGISADNTGAISDSDGTKNVTVKKIKGRGNSTWDYTDKKSFNVSYGSTVKIGGVSASKFSFLANFKDASFSRNKILYELADMMGVSYSPDVATVDLYMNGLYLGSYLACQKVDIGKDNLIYDVTEIKLDTATEQQLANFDFVMELDTKPGQDDYSILVSGDSSNKRYLTMKTPELPSSGSAPQAATNFIKDKYDKLVSALNGTSKTELENIIDIDSLAKFYLLNELAKNCDIGVASTYFVYKASAGKFYASPIWDLDMTAANGEKGSTYTSYEGNWTNINNPDYNVVMSAAFNNVNVQAAARALWTSSYYNELITDLNQLSSKALKITEAYTNNNIKWSQPYGFNYGFGDDIKARDSLSFATYNANETTKYNKAENRNYGNTPTGQINYVIDWLKSRAAWMTDKYNNYYITGDLTGLNNWGNTTTTMTNKNGINTYQVDLSAGNYEFKISTDGGADTYRSATAYSISYSPEMANNYTSSSSNITGLSVTDNNTNFTFTTSEQMTVYITYNQKTNTVTLSDQLSSTVEPTINLSKAADFDDSKVESGLSVTMTAKVTPLIIDGTAITGADKEYTVELFRDGSTTAIASKTITFAAEDTTKDVEFTTTLVDKNQSYTAKVSFTHEATPYEKTSNTVVYKQTGLKDQKIYFDPSVQYNNGTQTWKSKMTTSSTVTVTVTGSGIDTETFTMSVDSDDIHGFDKGVFVADITAETLAKLKNSANTITFTLDSDSALTTSTTGNASIKSGWIYNYSNQKDSQGNETQKLWEEYNTTTTASYPHSDITTYDQFKKYLAAMNGEVNEYSKYKATDKIVYFDNSVSKWYNVYIYGWNDSDSGSTSALKKTTFGLKMQKLPYADIWYYVFNSSTDLTNQKFLFKDRGDAGFGSDYQQTVDLVGNDYKTDYIVNGNDEKVYLNFQGTILQNPCPIFVTQNFYLSTIKNDDDKSDGIKYRAFNTEWQNFYTVVSNDVQTTAVDVYFDLHTAATVDNILLYHSSKNEAQFKFPSDFTRLTKLPNSTIYHASLLLPYTDAGELKFSFDQFVIGSGETAITKTMGTNAQPAFTCINTGEVWYEYAPSGLTYDHAKTTSILSAKSADDSASVGASETNASVAVDEGYYLIGGTTIYFKPNSTWQEASALFYADFFGATGTSDHKWIKLTYDSVSGAYAGTIPTPSSGTGYQKVIFCRVDPNTSLGESGSGWIGDSNFWTKTSDITSKSGMNMYTITATGDNYAVTSGSWSAYSTGETTTEYCLRGSGASINGNALTWISAFDDNLALSDSDGDGIYTVDVKITNENGKLQFEVFGKNGTTTTTYKASSGEPNMLDYSEASPFQTVSSNGNASMFINGTNGLTYTIYLNTNTTGNPTVWAALATQTYSVTVATGVSDVTVTPSTDITEGTSVKITPKDNNKKISSVTFDGKSLDVTLNPDGSATFKMPSNNVTITGVTFEDKPTTETEYCGVLGYNHSTATFASTEGGTITDAYVNLVKGYQNNETAIKTGYTTVTDGVYTVIYALTSTGNKSDAETHNVGVTDKTIETYQFNGWLKDNQPISGTGNVDHYTYIDPDKVSSTSVIEYVASWSVTPDVIYTFTYYYKEYDKKNGIEYAGTADDFDNYLNRDASTYTLSVNIQGGLTGDNLIKAVKEAFLSKAPKLQSDYFVYTFDSEKITVDTATNTANALADIDSVKKYTVNLKGDSISSSTYYYQNVVTLTPFETVESGKKVVWIDEDNNVLYVGNTYKFRVTRDIDIRYNIETDASITNATYVNEPTYEFYTSNNVEKIKFKVRVDNIVNSNTTVKEYGVLRFFTDENGMPLDSTISQDENISERALENFVENKGKETANASVKFFETTGIVNDEKKYIYAPTMTVNASNKEKYIRVYSYYITTDNDIIVSTDSVILSIKNAL